MLNSSWELAVSAEAWESLVDTILLLWEEETDGGAPDMESFEREVGRILLDKIGEVEGEWFE